MDHHYGHKLRLLYWLTDQAMTGALEKMELTAAQGHIMGYLSHRASPACLRDVEEEFHLSHPTVSGLLSRLEKKGFVEFRPDEHDRRVKRIHILPKGEQCRQTMHQTIADSQRRLVQGFTPEEQELFAQLLNRAIHNMGGDPCNCQHKEESNE